MEANGEQVDFYRATVPAWYKAVFAQSVPWTTAVGGMRELAPAAEVRLLRAVGAHMEAIGWVPNIPLEHIDSLVQTLQKARELVHDDPSLDGDVKRYILGLIREAEACFEDASTTDTVLIRRLSMELGGAMSTVAELKPAGDPKKDSWLATAKDILRSIGDKVTQKAIESGVNQAAAAIAQALP